MEHLSKTLNKDLMAQARQSLSGVWKPAVGATAVYLAIIIAVQLFPVIGGVAGLIVTGPMILGLCIFSLTLSRGKPLKVNQVFDGFKKFKVSLCAYLLQTIFIALWSLLLIIPGVIAALSYSLTFFLLADNEDIGPLQAIKKSNQLMRGNRWKLFCLGLRFIGWYLLSLLSLGIGFLWLVPYMMTSYAKFYDDLKPAHQE